MKNILFINACVRENSRTYALSKEVLKHLDGEIYELNLEKENIQPLNSVLLAKRDKLLAEKNYSSSYFSYANQFANADIILFACPYWDLAFPAMVKNYLEAVTVNNINFCYTKDGDIKGLCKAKKLFYVTTSGGTIGDYNFGYNYVKCLAEKLYGILDVTLFTAENLDIIGADVEQIMKNAKKNIETYFEEHIL
ncbi:MAG: NAD(P)H-dependent oxidoreductase [Acutalibacteraceae bacterium]